MIILSAFTYSEAFLLQLGVEVSPRELPKMKLH